MGNPITSRPGREILYLTVPPRDQDLAARVRANIGVMLTPRHRRSLERVLTYPVWAADTGCYAQGASFDLDAYLAWLAEMAPAQPWCLFATAPDVVGDAATTLRRSLPVLPLIRRLGYRAALVAQDGLEHLMVPWDAFDTLFVGGSTAWKLSEAAYGLVREANTRGLWTHMGRVNSRQRLRAAQLGGCDSADGTDLAFAPDRRLGCFTRWLAQIHAQPPLLQLGRALCSG